MPQTRRKQHDSDEWDSEGHIKTPFFELSGRGKWKAIRGWLALIAGIGGLFVGANSGWVAGVLQKLGE